MFLSQQLVTLLMIQQVVQQVQECIIPYIVYKFKKFGVKRRQNAESPRSSEVTAGKADDDVRRQAEIESAKDEYPVSWLNVSTVGNMIE